MIKPTVGRVVWALNVDEPEDQPPRAAIVTHVHSDSMVNLAIFEPDGNMHPWTSVPLVQEGALKPDDGVYCVWMPYQIGQARAAAADASKADTAKG